MRASWSSAANTGAARIARHVSEVNVNAKPPAKARHCGGVFHTGVSVSGAMRVRGGRRVSEDDASAEKRFHRLRGKFVRGRSGGGPWRRRGGVKGEAYESWRTRPTPICSE